MCNIKQLKHLLHTSVVLGVVVAPRLASAQDLRPTRQPGMENVGFDQKLNSAVPLDIPFRDESGKTVQIGTYFGKRPVLLIMPFFRCKGICATEMEGLFNMMALLKFDAGKEFQVVAVSINPKETPDEAGDRKNEYMQMYQRPTASEGLHFLTGTRAGIDRLADAVGFHYVYNEQKDDYAHPAGLMILTPDGHVSRYFFGASFSPRDVRLALVEASSNRIGSLADKISLLLCYEYDEHQGRYSPAIKKILRGAGIITVVVLASFMIVMFRMERRRVRLTPNMMNTPTDPTTPAGAEL